MTMEYKTIPFQIKAVGDGGEFEGYAAVFNNVDLGGDIILPGAFTKTLPDFLSKGLICWQHDTRTPIGRPLDAYEDSKGLYLKGTISDTQAGRDARLLMKDKVVQTMSIGYSTVECEWFDDDNISDYISADVMPVADMQRALCGGRALKELNLYEVSPVSIAMNPLAAITSVKGRLGNDLPFDAFSLLVVDATEELLQRSKSRIEMRTKEGRKLSAANVARLTNIRDRLKDSHEGITALLSDAEPVKEEPKSAIPNEQVLAAWGEYALTQARLNGVRI